MLFEHSLYPCLDKKMISADVICYITQKRFIFCNFWISKQTYIKQACKVAVIKNSCLFENDLVSEGPNSLKKIVVLNFRIIWSSW